MTIRHLAPGALFLILAGCAQYESEPLNPAVEYEELAARGRTADTPAPSSFLPADLFPLAPEVDLDDGLTLAEANSLALFHAPDLVAARGDLRLHGAELLRAGLLENPELFLGPRIASGGGGLIFPASLAFEIPLGGRLGAEEDRAAAEIDAARCRLLDREARTLVSVRRRFIVFAALKRRSVILQGVMKASEEVLASTEQLLRAGETDRVAFGLAALDRDEAAREMREADVERIEAQVALLVAIGLLPDRRIDVVTDPHLLDVGALPELDRAALLRHSRLKALEAHYRATEHGLQIEVARQYPSLRIGPEFESDDGQGSLGLGLSVSLPLFNGNAGGMAVARERRSAGREAWRAALLDLAGKEALARIRHARASSVLEEVRTRSMPAADRAERALEARWRGGQSSLIENMAARNAIARARLREVELMREAAIQGLEALWYSGRLFAAVHDDDGPGDER